MQSLHLYDRLHTQSSRFLKQHSVELKMSSSCSNSAGICCKFVVSLDWLLKQWAVCVLYCVINWTESFSETFHFNPKNRIVFALHVCSLCFRPSLMGSLTLKHLMWMSMSIMRYVVRFVYAVCQFVWCACECFSNLKPHVLRDSAQNVQSYAWVIDMLLLSQRLCTSSQVLSLEVTTIYSGYCKYDSPHSKKLHCQSNL